MMIHTLDFDDHPYPGLDKIQTWIWMKNHTLDSNDDPYSGLDKIRLTKKKQSLFWSR